MSEAVLPSIGSRLRSAREAQGLTVEDAAGRLRLMHRQIDAMEREDFDSLGQAVFARGFVRNYARLLGLDPESLLADMAGAPTDSVPVAQPVPPRPPQSRLSPWLLLLALGVVLAVAVPVGLYWWLNSDVEALHPVAAVPQTPATPARVSVPAKTLAPAVPEASTAAAVGPAVSEAQAQPASAAEPVARGTLEIEFGDESWVEIKDANGKMLMRQLNAAGSRAEIAGQPPFDLLIGNAAQARLSYNGRPIDIKPFIDVTVARFTLEE